MQNGHNITIGVITYLETLVLFVFLKIHFGSEICLNILDWLLSFYNGFSMFQITSDCQSEYISDWCVFQIGFRLVSDWFHIVMKNFRLCLQILDCFRFISYSFQTGLKKLQKLQILSSHFRFLQIGQILDSGG